MPGPLTLSWSPTLLAQQVRRFSTTEFSLGSVKSPVDSRSGSVECRATDVEKGRRIVTIQEQLAEAFHDTQSFKCDREKGFKLASGEVSPFYVDCRAIMAHPEARRLVAQLAYEALVKSTSIVGGLELGAIPIALTISDFACASSPQRSGGHSSCASSPKTMDWES